MIEDLKINKKKISFKDSITIYKKPLYICLLLAFANIYNGAITLFLYSVNIFLEYVTLETATLLTNGLVLTNLIGVFAGFKILEKYGRR